MTAVTRSLRSPPLHCENVQLLVDDDDDDSGGGATVTLDRMLAHFYTTDISVLSSDTSSMLHHAHSARSRTLAQECVVAPRDALVRFVRSVVRPLARPNAPKLNVAVIHRSAGDSPKKTNVSRPPGPTRSDTRAAAAS